ncbi:ABC transporter permease [Paenibacillus sp. MER 180]|uniref:ABC transporter permease n=1 Tax=Paenibacillus sp. MER 180 TaxID=2939570 RepID=UPI00203D03DC|nr:ABC transporter permease [Paenibacillus sp. MER 180]MCM3292439.1 ABC transporter permease [Paenibacillus sp. MER 180]
MIGKLLSSDFVKIRHTWIWLLIVLGPVGVISLQAINYSLRYDYLVSKLKDQVWIGLLSDIKMLAVLALLFGVTLVTSLIASIEHRQRSWKQLLALPVSRFSVFSSKYILSLFMMFTASLLLAVGSVLLGLLLGFGTDIPWFLLLKNSFYPFLAAMPILALQLWLSTVISNQAIPLTCGILGTIVSVYSIRMPDWMPYKWPLLVNEANIPEYSVIAGILIGFVVFLFSLVHFIRRDVD